MFDISQYQGDFRTVVTSTQVNYGAFVQLVKPNPNRAVLYFGNAYGYALWLNLSGSIYTNPPSLVVPANTSMGLTWITDGVMPTLEWWGMFPPGASAANVTTTEVIWMPGEEE